MLAAPITARSFARHVMPDLIRHLIFGNLNGNGFEAHAVRPDVEPVLRDEVKFVARVGPHDAEARKLAALVALEFRTQPAQAPAQFHPGLFLRHARFPHDLVQQELPLFQRNLRLMERHLPVRGMNGGLAVGIGGRLHFGRKTAQIRDVNPVVLHDEFLDAFRE